VNSRVKWYADRIAHITTVAPQRAHDRASAHAAATAAKAIKSKGTGDLARDVSVPKKLGPNHSAVGSNKVYAGIQNNGGTITARTADALYIRGKRGATRSAGGAPTGGTRSAFGGDIVAVVDEVTIPAKHYLEEAVEVFPKLYVDELRRALRG
jgi:phage gpG-like protein